MKAITKRQAEKLFNAGRTVYFMPSKFFYDQSIYAPSIVRKSEIECTFKDYIKDYENNYCNKNVGNKVKFWSY